MEAVFSKEIQAGLDQARIDAMRRSSRLRIVIGGEVYPVLRLWKSGFALEAGRAPGLRGFVDLYDGANHLFQCLIVASEEEAGERLFEFKRATAIARGPALDFERSANAPVALIESEDRVA
ncbi:hypothetical protein R5H30_04950 [Sulfitobacter sp. D35]|uniref:hypothetical protein n=1 Tax=Sulfitobacter sp. D35 TaxID=3083252 RepID=UPI00296EBC4C|nr:hypothetical protein [Sulfitobacter sp. D35]MDW4497320.1 hypothetical protein [Sulfitobacter sp. D35]